MTADAALQIHLTRIPTDKFAASDVERMRLKLKVERFEAFAGPFHEIEQYVVPTFLDNSDAFMSRNLADAISEIEKANRRFSIAVNRLSEIIHQYGLDKSHYFSSALERQTGIRNIIWSLSDIEERLRDLAESRIQNFLSGVHDALYTFIEEPLLDFENGFSNFKSDHTYLDLIKRMPIINDERNIIGEKINFVGLLIGQAVEN